MFLNSTNNEDKKINWLRIIVASFFIVLLFIITSYFVFEENYKNRIYPGVRLSDIDLSGLSRLQAKEKIAKRINDIEENGIKFTYDNHNTIITPIVSSLEGDLAYQIINFNKEEAIEKVFNFGRSTGIINDVKVKLIAIKTGININIPVKIESEEVEKILAENFKQFEQNGQNARLVATSSKGWARRIDFSIKKEQTGYKLNFKKATSQLEKNLSKLDNTSIEIAVKKDIPAINKSDCLNIEKTAQELIALAPITLKYEKKEWLIEKAILADWLQLKKGVNDKVVIDLNDDKIKKYLDDFVAVELNQPAVNARFEVKDNRVINFVTSADGKKVNNLKTISILRKQFLTEKLKESKIIVEVEKSKISTGDVNDLGIKELIGTGHSNFVGSSKNRIHNITTGSNSLSGVIIKPGEEFSLMKTLGEINKKSGYLPELVIRGNKTIPEYGGGLCQVGTTLFRTVLKTGLPVTQRRNHSYRVSYYEPAGTDATIYDPWPDFRFINDTKNHILILYRIDGNDIYFDFWGTKDGRQVEMTDPTIYNITKPGKTKLIETTDLKPGEKKCTERAHNGADAYFDYKVTYLNKEIKETRFKSHYSPWRAVCLIGVEKLSKDKASSTPETVK